MEDKRTVRAYMDAVAVKFIVPSSISLKSTCHSETQGHHITCSSGGAVAVVEGSFTSGWGRPLHFLRLSIVMIVCELGSLCRLSAISGAGLHGQLKTQNGPVLLSVTCVRAASIVYMYSCV